MKRIFSWFKHRVKESGKPKDALHDALVEQAKNLNEQRLASGSPTISENYPSITRDLTICRRELHRMDSLMVRSYFRAMSAYARMLRNGRVAYRVSVLSGGDVDCNDHGDKFVFRFEVFNPPADFDEVFGDPSDVRLLPGGVFVMGNVPNPLGLGKPEAIEELVGRFAGVDLQGRRIISDSWPKRWRAVNITSKNESNSFRVTVWGDTAAEAATALFAEIDRRTGTSR